MIEPRKRFQDQCKARNWRWQDMVDSEMFHEAAMAAYAEMQMREAKQTITENAAAAHWRADGAKSFLAILMDLTFPEPLPGVAIRQNLQHKL